VNYVNQKIPAVVVVSLIKYSTKAVRDRLSPTRPNYEKCRTLQCWSECCFNY